MITWIKRLLLTIMFLALIATNILTLTHTAFNAALSGLTATTFGIQTVSEVLRSKVEARNKTIKNRKLATRKFGGKSWGRPCK